MSDFAKLLQYSSNLVKWSTLIVCFFLINPGTLT